MRGHRKVKGGFPILRLGGGRKTEPQRPMGEAQYLKVQTDPRVISICFAFHLIFSDKLRSAVKKSGFLSLYIYIEREIEVFGEKGDFENDKATEAKNERMLKGTQFFSASFLVLAFVSGGS